MEKYFKIEMRIARGIRQLNSGNLQLVDLFYYGDGYIRIVDDKIYGVIALDYLEGVIDEDIVKLLLFTEDKEFEIEIKKDDFCLPQNFLIEYDDIAIQFDVKETVREPKKQQMIREDIENARIYVGLDE